MTKQAWYTYTQDLLLLAGMCTVAVGAAFLLPSSPVRLLLGSGLLLFAPGYVLIAILYPEEGSIEPWQRFFASIGLSVVISSLLGLIITYATSTTLLSISGMLALWVIGMSFVAGYRRSLCPTPERFAPHMALHLAKWRTRAGEFNWIRVTKMAAMLILLTAVTRLLVISHKTVPQFSEFYILGRDGMIGSYTEHVTAGTPLQVTVGVVNHGASTQYQLFYSTDDSDYVRIGEFLLGDNEKWESELTLPLPPSPRYQKITLALHKSGTDFPYRRLYLWAYVE